MYKLHMYDMIYMYLTTKKLETINLKEKERDKGICLGRVGGRQGKVEKM